MAPQRTLGTQRLETAQTELSDRKQHGQNPWEANKTGSCSGFLGSRAGRGFGIPAIVPHNGSEIGGPTEIIQL
jgi:hypothetical protein